MTPPLAVRGKSKAPAGAAKAQTKKLALSSRIESTEIKLFYGWDALAFPAPELRRLVIVSSHMDLTDNDTSRSNEHGTPDMPCAFESGLRQDYNADNTEVEETY